MRILSGDPGKVNFALSVLDVDGPKLNFIGTRMFRNPVPTLAGDIAQSIKDFEKELKQLNKDYGPFDVVCFERFQSRGLKGNTIECISLMLGLIAQHYVSKKIPVMLITAAQWKNAFNKELDLKGLYAHHKMSTKQFKKEIHEFDAALIGIYAFCHMKDIVPFSGFADHADTLVPKFENCPILQG